MGFYLNPGNDLFKELISSEVYVDKTMLIDFTNKVLETTKKEICVSRPRRFGKSMTENMLVAYYSKGCESKELFSNFNIAQTINFEKYLNKYNVIFIDLKSISWNINNIIDLINVFQRKIVNDLCEEFIFIDRNSDLISALTSIYNKTHEKFIFIIDEWDVVFREYTDDKVGQKFYLDFLCSLWKGKSYVSLVYMTGILPIKKYGKHSALNMFKEYTMLNQKRLASFTGFTEEEVKNLCNKFDISFEKVKQWYDGYIINGYSIYNPNSVVEVVTERVFDNYWTSTETYESLSVYLHLNINGLRDKIIQLLTGDSVSIDVITFKNDMCNLTSADNVLTLLVHLGYLTYNFNTEQVSIPNKEIRKEFISSLRDNDYEPLIKLIEQSNKLLEYTLEKNNFMVAQMLDNVHADNTSILQYNDENALSYVLKLAYYSAQNSYTFSRELKGGYGFADIVMLPQIGNNNPAIIIELKWNKDVETALNQIKNKGYIKSLQDYNGKVLLVGINYNKKTKKHECLIEETIV